MKKKQFALVLLLGGALAGQGQNAAPKGPPYFPGMSGFKLVDSGNSKIQVETDKVSAEKAGTPVDFAQTDYVYTLSSRSGQARVTKLMVSEHYASLMKKAPGSKSSEHKGRPGDEYFAGGYTHNGREVWINVAEFKFDKKDSSVTGYTIRYLETPQPGYINAKTMNEAIRKDGKVALDIHFEPGKATVMEESMSQVYELVTMLRNDPSLKVSIEGHTDKMGSSAQNMELSEARAKAVRDIVRKKGIDPGRLSTVGWGWNKPVSDNKTEIGRAKNRRVEIVRK